MTENLHWLKPTKVLRTVWRRTKCGRYGIETYKGSRLSGLQYVTYKDGKRMTRYGDRTLRAALERCQADANGTPKPDIS